MSTHESLQSYLIWLADRGFAYPWPGSSVTPPGEALPQAQVRLLALSAEPLSAEERTLLDKMITAMGLSPEQVMISDSPAAIPAWQGLVAELILVLGPKAGLLLGLAPAAWGSARGKLQPHPHAAVGLLPITHPRDLIRQPSDKRQAWADLQQGMRCLGLLPPLHS